MTRLVCLLCLNHVPVLTLRCRCAPSSRHLSRNSQTNGRWAVCVTRHGLLPASPMHVRLGRRFEEYYCLSSGDQVFCRHACRLSGPIARTLVLITTLSGMRGMRWHGCLVQHQQTRFHPKFIFAHSAPISFQHGYGFQVTLTLMWCPDRRCSGNSRSSLSSGHVPRCV